MSINDKELESKLENLAFDVNDNNKNYTVPKNLSYLCIRGDPELVRQNLGQFNDPEDARLAMRIAIKRNNPVLVEILYDKYTYQYQHDPFVWRLAAAQPRKEILEILLRNDEILSSDNTFKKWHPIVVASREGHLENVKLLSFNKNNSFRSSIKLAAIKQASIHGNYDVLKYLLDNSQETDELLKNNISEYKYAFEKLIDSGHIEVAKRFALNRNVKFISEPVRNSLILKCALHYDLLKIIIRRSDVSKELYRLPSNFFNIVQETAKIEWQINKKKFEEKELKNNPVELKKLYQQFIQFKSYNRINDDQNNFEKFKDKMSEEAGRNLSKFKELKRQLHYNKFIIDIDDINELI